jgi:type IV pilus assembly protein PilV
MKNTSGGYSMVETLVSLLVLAVGVTGVAGMQLNALQTTQDAGHQSVALELAEELLEKMRANTVQMAAASNPFLDIDFQADDDASEMEFSCSGISTDCDASALASYDIGEWKKKVAAALPSARVVVCRDAAPYDFEQRRYVWECTDEDTAPVVVKLAWSEKGREPSEQDERPPLLPTVVLVAEVAAP